MKKQIFTLFIIFFISLAVYSQNYNWITPNTPYLKMYIIEDGMYRIEKSDFTNAGINTSSIDPRTIKVYYKGNQIPIYFYGEDDGVFNDTDYFDFYGQRNYGGLTNTYNVYNQIAYVTDEYYNLYSDTNCYWIGWGGSYGLRYINYTYSVSSPYPINYFKEKLHFEIDLEYSLGISTGSGDYRNFMNDKFEGEGWYWKQMAYNNTHNQIFIPINFQATSDQFEFKIFAYPINFSSSVPLEHRIMVRLNNNLIDTIKSEDLNRIDTVRYFPGTFFLPSGNNTLTIKYTPPSNFTSGKIYLDMFEITYPRKFQFDSNKLSFKNLTSDSTSKLFRISGFNPANATYIYDNKNGYRIINYYYSSDTLYFTGKCNGSFEVYNKQITKKPLRIKQRQVPNLVSSSNGADYLIVYNKLFETQAEQLRQYRASHNGFRSFKAEIEDIYDIFNFGIEDPVAVKRFVKYVYQYWQAPSVKFLCLFGRGSEDPKKINTSALYYKNLVPVYGMPVTDGYFANLNEGSFTYYHHISTGRIPVYTTQEATDVVNKIIQYENFQYDDWVKTGVLLTGGYTRDDQVNCIIQSEYLNNTYISAPPLSIKPEKIYLTDTTGFVSFNYYDSVIHTVNRNCVFVNYIGHAGNGWWDFTFEDPDELNNSRYPLVFSMTCFTGKFSEIDRRSYGEKFLYLPNKGAIGSISTTGWSFSASGNTFNEKCLEGFALDSVRVLGDIIRYANNTMAPDSNSFPVRNTINCYNLIGDPATTVKIPRYPEFAILQSHYKLSPTYPKIGDNLNIKLYPRNYGTFADSCKIRFQIFKDNSLLINQDTIVKNFKFIDSLNKYFRIDSLGSYVIKLILDCDNWYQNEDESNNTLLININPQNYSFYPLKPIDNQIIYNDTVEIVGIIPSLKSVTNNKYLLQVDTSSSFNSPILGNYMTTNSQGTTAKFKVSVPLVDSNVVYYWRLNAILNNQDTLKWTTPRKFYVRASKYTDSEYIDSIITITRYKPTHFQGDELFNLMFSSNGIELNKYEGNVVSSSFGGGPWDPSYMIINDKYIYLVGDPHVSGLVMCKVRKTDGAILEYNHTFYSSATSNDSVMNFLNSFDTNHILVALKTMPIFATNELNTTVRNRFKQFGSTYIDSVNVKSWSRWSFISYQGLPNPVVAEKFINPGWVSAKSVLKPDFVYINGNLSMIFGPAESWKNFNWTQVLYPKNTIKFDVYGITKTNQQVLLYQNLTNNNFISLDTINAYNYPQIKLVSKLSIDTTGSFSDRGIYGGILSPVFKSVSLNYVPPTELSIDYTSLIRSDSIINENDSVGISVRYYNIGFKNCYGSLRQVYFYRGNEKIPIAVDTSFKTLNVDSSDSFKKYVKFSGLLPPFRKSNEKIVLYFEVSPLGNQNEIYTYNNIINTDVFIRSNVTSGQMELFADGIKLQGGEYVRKNSEFTVKYIKKDNIPYSLIDTSLFKIFVNDKLQSFGDKRITKKEISDAVRITGKVNEYETDKEKSGFEQINSLNFYPDLSDGENIIKLLSRRSIETPFDTIKYVVLVSNELFVKDLYNYPNPMKNETVFMFTIAGNMVFDCKIKIYTVSGKLIKTIYSPVNIGYNQIYWNGRDEDGDEVANGVYFYKLIIEGDGKKETPIQKLVILK